MKFRAFLLTPAAAAFAAAAAAAPCDVELTLDVTPRNPDDGTTVTYTVEYCDTTGFDADIFGGFSVSYSRNNFIPGSGVWTSCPAPYSCFANQGTMDIGAFTLAANSCVSFEFTLDLQPGLGGQNVCIQGLSPLASSSPPQIPFPCNKQTEDPFGGGPTCVTVNDPVPGCDITAMVDPGFVATCAGSGETLTCVATQTGCPGGTLTYEWTIDGVPIPGATMQTYAISPSEPPGGHQYKCIAICAAEPLCKGASFPAQVTILGNTATVNAPSSACINDPVSVSATGSMACTIDCGNTQPPVMTCNTTCTYTNPGMYTIQVTTDDGTCQVIQNLPIDIFDQPNACIGNITSLCEDDPAGPTVLDLTSCSPSGLNYSWTTTLGNLSDPNAENPILTLPDVSVTTPVTVTLDVVDPGGCGVADSTQLTFDLEPAPTATGGFAATDCTVDFTGDGAGTPGPFDFFWDFDDGNTSTMQNPTHTYTADGTYDVTLTVTDQVTGCSAVDSFQVDVTCVGCVTPIPEVPRLMAVKQPVVNPQSDVLVTWDPVVEASDGYNLWAVTVKTDIPNAREPGGLGIRAVCRPTPTEMCVDVGVIPPAPDPLIYYQSRGVCGGNEGE